MNGFEKEVKQRWGDTAAYREYLQRGDAYDATDGLMRIFSDFALCKMAGDAVDSKKAQALVQKLQDYITAHFYTCTKEILVGLGQMYVADERFRANIDHYGEGTAEYAAKAIAVYCK